MTQYEFTNQYDRNQDDFYIDPPFCSRLLFQRVKFDGSITDPACGTGNIIRMAKDAGYMTNCSDKYDRGLIGTTVEDFLQQIRIHSNIVTNPPYDQCEAFAHHALHTVTNKVALLTRLAFLEGQKRYKTLFRPFPPALVLVFSTRPSMPPPGVLAGGGKTAYCWIIWDKHYQGPTRLDWLLREWVSSVG